jgi:multiple antibiotic resistance protein
MLQVGVSALIMLVATIGPLEGAAIFTVLTAALTPAEKRRVAVRAVLIAGIVLLGFAAGGVAVLDLLHISLPAFRLAGGLMLLLVSIDLMFAHPSGLTSITSAEAEEAEGQRDIAVFPLAIPLIAGPGSMAAVVLLVSEAGGLAHWAVVVGALLAVLLLTLAALMLSVPITRLLGVTGVKVVARVSGILLASLSMQLILDGLRESRVFVSAG